MPKKNKKSKGALDLGKRQWVGTSDLIDHANVFPVSQSDNTYLISIEKRDAPKKTSHDERFHLYPFWSMQFRGNTFRKDLQDMLSLLQDTFLAETSIPIELRWKPTSKGNRTSGFVRKPGVLTGFVGQKGDDEGVIKHSKTHNFHFHVKMGCRLPEDLDNFSIRIVGDLLPKGRYQYGYCAKMDGRWMVCSDFGYLENHTDTNMWFGKHRCRPADLTKGNPNIYCSFKEGT